MESIAKLFSFKGRTSRLDYWRVLLLIAVIVLVVWGGGLTLAFSTGIAAFGAVAMVGLVPVLVIQSAAMFRRLHDRGKSAWWLLPYYVGPFAADGLIETPWATARLPALVLELVALAAFGFLTWGFVEIALRRGTHGPNRYGAEPPIAQGGRATQARLRLIGESGLGAAKLS